MGMKNQLAGESTNLGVQAKVLLQMLRDHSEYEAAKHADEYLTYLYTLRDCYRIFRFQQSGTVSGSVVNVAHILEHLESKPEEVFQRSELKEFLVSLLEDIACGKVKLLKKA